MRGNRSLGRLAPAFVLGTLAVPAIMLARQGAATGRLTIDALVDIRHPSAATWSPDGARVAFVWDRAGVQNLWVVEWDAGRASPPRALTTFAAGDVTGPFWSADGGAVHFAHDGDLWRADVSPASGPRPVWTTPAGEGAIVPSPDRRRVAFVREGDVFVRALDTGAETRLTQTPAVEAAPAWSPDGARIAFTSAFVKRHEDAPSYSGAKILYTWIERTPLDVQVVEAGGGVAVTVAPSEAVERAPRWVDASRLVFERVSVDTTTREIVLGDARTGEGRVLLREVDEKWWSIPPAAQPGPAPSPDGRWVAFVSDRDGWDHVYVIPAGGGDPVQVTRGRFEAWRPAWSPDGTRIAFDASDADDPGRRHVGVVTLDGRPADARISMVTAGGGTNVAAQWSPDGRRLVYQHTDPRSPADLFVSDSAATGGAGATRLTDSLPAAVDRQALVSPKLVWYEGPDGQRVPASLFVPPGLDPSRKHPAIVWIHGDGVNQNYDGWHVERNYAVYYSFHQYLLQQGYVVLAPDYRGSIGYGRAWRQGVFLEVGGKDYEDAALGARYLRSLDFVDPARIGVWGLSYGGFFTLQALALAPDDFRCGVNVAGVADYRMYYADPYRGAWTHGRLRAPEDNPAAYDVASPLSRVGRIKSPLLILHGTADVNVPYLQSVRLVDELLKARKDFEFMVYPGEFHYFTREHVLRDAWSRVERFWRRCL